jgi:16S rRNA (uracil1498-N3)-methyltransferase
MRKTRVYIESGLQIGEIVNLNDDSAHHLGRVLKVRTGDFVQAFNGHGGCYDAEIVSVDKKSVSIKPVRFLAENNESPLVLTLAQGISRGQHMDYTVQKAVELGVSKIVPLFTEFSNVRLEGDRTGKRLEHWQKIITSACEQSGRNILPKLDEPALLQDWVNKDMSSLKLLMHPDAEQGLTSLTTGINSITLLCGPEGGLSQKEIEFALACGYQTISLGPRILRTETAAIAAIAVCQALRGDMMYNREPKN